MSSPLHQIQLTYDQAQDRLILTVSTQDLNEFRFWITRHMLKKLWEVLQKVREMFAKDSTQQQEENVQASTQVQKEMQQPTANKYGTRMSRRPLGEEPLLLHKFSITPNKQRQVIFCLEDTQTKKIEFSGDGVLLAALCQLIQKTTSQTDWDLTLQ